MPRQYYTLLHTARELDTLLKTRLVTEIFTQEKNSVILFAESSKDVAIIEISVDSKRGGVFLRRQYHRARKNTLDLFPEFLHSSIREVRLVPGERALQIQGQQGTLIIQLFGSAHGSILFADNDQIVRAMYKADESILHKEWRIERVRLPYIDEITEPLTLVKALSSSGYLLGKRYARELCYRYGYSENLPFAQWQPLTDEIHTHALQLIDDIKHTRQWYLYNYEQNMPFCAHIELQHIQGQTPEKYTSVLELTARWQSLIRRKEFIESTQKRAKTLLDKKYHKIKHTLDKILDDSLSIQREQQRRLFGELLLAKEPLQQKGRDAVVVEGWDGESVHIPLKPELTTRENADIYFTAAKKSKAAAKVREKRLEQYLELMEVVEHCKQQFQLATTFDELQQWVQQYGDFIGMEQQQQKQSSQSGGQPTFRSFDLGEGYILYVGKSAAENDELTVRFAKPNDIWLHARGVAGSHAVLKGGNPDKKPPKYVLEAAASIAAYYSKARNAGFTPVAYTRKKYVRKPKNAATGAVVMEREEVIMVKPGLPNGETE